MKPALALDTAARGTQRRAYWLKTLHQWHWISSAIALVGMLLFAITGITLNHAAQIESRPSVHTREALLPKTLLPDLAREHGATAPLPPTVIAWVTRELGLELPVQPAEWSPGEVLLSSPRPGGDAWLRVDRMSGAVEYERTDRGWIS